MKELYNFMARFKNLSYKMKRYITKNMKLDCDEWGYLKNTPTEFVIVNKETGKTRTIDKVERNITTF